MVGLLILIRSFPVALLQKVVIVGYLDLLQVACAYNEIPSIVQGMLTDEYAKPPGWTLTTCRLPTLSLACLARCG